MKLKGLTFSCLPSEKASLCYSASLGQCLVRRRGMGGLPEFMFARSVDRAAAMPLMVGSELTARCLKRELYITDL